MVRNTLGSSESTAFHCSHTSLRASIPTTGLTLSLLDAAWLRFLPPPPERDERKDSTCLKSTQLHHCSQKTFSKTPPHTTAPTTHPNVPNLLSSPQTSTCAKQCETQAQTRSGTADNGPQGSRKIVVRSSRRQRQSCLFPCIYFVMIMHLNMVFCAWLCGVVAAGRTLCFARSICCCCCSTRQLHVSRCIRWRECVQ